MTFNDMKLSKKIFLGSLMLTVVFGVLLACFYPIMTKMHNQTKKQKVLNLVESAMGILEYYNDQVKTGQMQLPDAQKNAMKVVGSLRYDEKDYFWIIDYNNVMVMHPFSTDLVGKDQSGYQDAKGKNLFRDMVQVAKNKGGGFVEYYWIKPNDKTPSHKTSYAKAFQPWGWVIGTGIYTNDVDQELVAAMRWFKIIAVAALAVTIGSLLLMVLVTRSITRPIDRIISGISESSEQLAEASSQIASSSHHLADGASSQASSLEETSSSLEELTSMTKQNAQNAEQAKTMTGEAQKIVERVNVNMISMAEAIDDVRKSSEETDKIIRTIDEIAFQTNLLALNAAVEAARAGEAGAGFAVVADEVRNLALRSAEAAKNTSSLIENTIKSVRNGNEMTKQTQEAFKENMEIATRIGGLVSEIAAASQEQALGIEQISKAIVEMDKVTQSTAASAEESASASEALNSQALQMRSFVGDLKILVNGRTNGNNGAVPEKKLETPAIPTAGPARRVKPSRPALPGNGQTRAAAAIASRVMRADQMIPMEGDSFKNF